MVALPVRLYLGALAISGPGGRAPVGCDAGALPKAGALLRGSEPDHGLRTRP